YFIFAILIIIRLIEQDIKKLSGRIIAYITIIFLLILIFQLQSKAGILSIIIISIYYLAFAFIRSKPIVLRASFLVLAVSLSLTYIQKESRLQSMTTSLETIQKEGQSSGSTGIRYSMWTITAQDLKNHWLTGVGAGDIKPELFIIYKEKGLTEAIKGNFNIHNQYLETFYGQGIIGISLLLLLLFMGLRESLKRKELLLSGFVILIALSFGPESMLNSQMGVVFFSFFYYFLFSFTAEPKKPQSY
ncbi:MAG: O-antigen ligase family protein, partial [Bacteroidales bacterium]|nr:O-antigen ligase family protein [Bacteroidales bacterium]